MHSTGTTSIYSCHQFADPKPDTHKQMRHLQIYHTFQKYRRAMSGTKKCSLVFLTRYFPEKIQIAKGLIKCDNPGYTGHALVFSQWTFSPEWSGGPAVGYLHLQLQQVYCSAQTVPCGTFLMLSEAQKSTVAVLSAVKVSYCSLYLLVNFFNLTLFKIFVMKKY